MKLSEFLFVSWSGAKGRISEYEVTSILQKLVDLGSQFYPWNVNVRKSLLLEHVDLKD